MIVVDCDVRIAAVGDRSARMCETVPDRWASSVLVDGSFYLISRCRRSPQKAFGKAGTGARAGQGAFRARFGPTELDEVRRCTKSRRPACKLGKMTPGKSVEQHRFGPRQICLRAKLVCRSAQVNMISLQLNSESHKLLQPDRHALLRTQTIAFRKPLALFIASLSIVAAVLWWLGRPVALSSAPTDPAAKLDCVSYAPFRDSQTPFESGLIISPEQIASDLVQLAKVSRCVRTYSIDNGLDKVP